MTPLLLLLPHLLQLLNVLANGSGPTPWPTVPPPPRPVSSSLYMACKY